MTGSKPYCEVRLQCCLYEPDVSLCSGNFFHLLFNALFRYAVHYHHTTTMVSTCLVEVSPLGQMKVAVARVQRDHLHSTWRLKAKRTIQRRRDKRCNTNDRKRNGGKKSGDRCSKTRKKKRKTEGHGGRLFTQPVPAKVSPCMYEASRKAHRGVTGQSPDSISAIWDWIQGGEWAYMAVHWVRHIWYCRNPEQGVEKGMKA